MALSLVYTRTKAKKNNKKDTKAIWDEGKQLKVNCRGLRMGMEKKKIIKKLLAPCCSYGHKTWSMYVPSNITINEIVNKVAIKLYRFALQSKYKNMLPSYNSRLHSVKLKSYLLIEVSNITVPGILPSIQTDSRCFTNIKEKIMHGQTAGVRSIHHLYPT